MARATQAPQRSETAWRIRLLRCLPYDHKESFNHLIWSVVGSPPYGMSSLAKRRLFTNASTNFRDQERLLSLLLEGWTVGCARGGIQSNGRIQATVVGQK